MHSQSVHNIIYDNSLVFLVWNCQVTYITIYFYSYSLLLQCWDGQPEERPDFSQLVVTISAIMEAVADYVTFSASDKEKFAPDTSLLYCNPTLLDWFKELCHTLCISLILSALNYYIQHEYNHYVKWVVCYFALDTSLLYCNSSGLDHDSKKWKHCT